MSAPFPSHSFELLKSSTFESVDLELDTVSSVDSDELEKGLAPESEQKEGHSLLTKSAIVGSVTGMVLAFANFALQMVIIMSVSNRDTQNVLAHPSDINPKRLAIANAALPEFFFWPLLPALLRVIFTNQTTRTGIITYVCVISLYLLFGALNTTAYLQNGVPGLLGPYQPPAPSPYDVQGLEIDDYNSKWKRVPIMWKVGTGLFFGIAALFAYSAVVFATVLKRQSRK